MDVVWSDGSQLMIYRFGQKLKWDDFGLGERFHFELVDFEMFYIQQVIMWEFPLKTEIHRAAQMSEIKRHTNHKLG